MRLTVEEIKEKATGPILKLRQRRGSFKEIDHYSINLYGSHEVFLCHDAWLHKDLPPVVKHGRHPSIFTSVTEAQGHVAIFAKQMKRHGIEVFCLS